MDLAKIPPEVISYLENLLKEAGITPVDEAMREQLLLELYSRLDNFITTKIMENIPPEKLNEFIKLNEGNKPREEIEKYMKENISDSDQVFARAFIDFRDLYLGNIGVSANQANTPPSS